MLVRTFDAWDLKKEFIECGRDYFSLEACEIIVELFDECYNEPIELDIIGLCGDFTEESCDYIKNAYSNIEEIKNAETMEELLEALNYHTLAYNTVDDLILYQAF